MQELIKKVEKQLIFAQTELKPFVAPNGEVIISQESIDDIIVKLKKALGNLKSRI